MRNPYFHRVDQGGQQLPYIDRFVMQVIDPKLIPIKTGAGETDLQARGLDFKDYTFLKQSEARSGLRTLLWPEGRAAHLALYPNLNASDPVWRGLFRDLRFRQALSLGLDRDAINQFLYFGLAEPANNTDPAGEPLVGGRARRRVRRLRPGRGGPAARRASASTGARRTAPGSCRTGARWSWWSRPPGEDTEQTDLLELCATSGARSA